MSRQLGVLCALRRPATMRYVADKLGCTRNAASTAISRAKKLGLLRSRPASWGRALYSLTPAGRAELVKGAR